MTNEMTPAQALAYFDSLAPVAPDDMMGFWRGEIIRTGHDLDDLLVASGWYGKIFEDTETVHPLVFQGAFGGFYIVNPALLPLRLACRIPRLASVLPFLMPLLRPLLATSKPRARLRAVAYRGQISAAMIYDAKPIIDVFRRIDASSVLGLMDSRGDATPCFFRLTKER